MARLDPKANFHGFTMMEARRALRRFPDGPHAGRGWQIAIVGGMTPARAKQLVDALLADGLLACCEGGDEYFHTTESGNRLALASARTIGRPRAATMLDAVVQRAGGINANAQLCFQIETLIVFGSYAASTQERLGDLDVAYLMLPRFERGSRAQLDAEEAARARASSAGRQFSSMIEQVYWPEWEVKLALKARTAGLSLHNLQDNESIVLNGPHQVAYRRGRDDA